MKIRTQADIEKLEQVPVTERIRHASVADLLHDSAREHSGRVAIRYLAGTGPTDPVRDVFRQPRELMITSDETARQQVALSRVLGLNCVREAALAIDGLDECRGAAVAIARLLRA